MVRLSISDTSPVIPISTAADILGVHTRTLMLYEYERLVVPQRDVQNRRMYSQNDMKKLLFIHYLTQKRKLNFAGVRLVFDMIEKGNEKGIDFKKLMFSDFKEN